MRIAIVGTGVSGLVTARLLHPGHDVTVFEAANRLGGHVNTVRVPEGPDRPERPVDTGFIVFNETSYPSFTKLMRRLDVGTLDTSMSFSVRCERTGLEYAGDTLATLFAQKRNAVRPGFLGMVRDIVRFYRHAQTQVRESPGLSVEAFVEHYRYGREFLERHLVPMGAAIWSSPPGRFREFPMRFVIDFFDHHRMLQLGRRPVWKIIEGGSSRYVEELVRPFRNRVRLGCPVRSVSRDGSGVSVRSVAGEERFDEIVFACHSDQALALLDDPSAREREILASLPYQRNDAVLHTDATVLPRRRRAWASWNYRIRPGERRPAIVSYHMNRLQRMRTDTDYCVTLNDPAGVDPARVLERMVYEHPQYTVEGEGARARHTELIRADRTSYCGAYWGFGFHEDGVRSAEKVARRYGVEDGVESVS